MSNDFSKLKKSSGNLDNLKQKLQSMASSETKSDKDNYWKPEVDKAGNGMATIRFLPAAAVDGDDGRLGDGGGRISLGRLS